MKLPIGADQQPASPGNRFSSSLTRLASSRTLGPILVGCIVFVVYLSCLKYGFVNWDDEINLVNNDGFRGFDLSHLKWMWTNRLLEHWAPLTWMSFALDYSIWGRAALGYHLTNILLHAANTGLFFCVARLIFDLTIPSYLRSRVAVAGASAFAALLFGLHPLRVESVVWVTERRDVLSGLFFFLALIAYLSGCRRETGSRWRVWYGLCLTFFVCGVLSKEMVVTLPAILLILDVYPLRRLGGARGRWFGSAVWRVWLEKIPFFVVAAASSAATLYFAARHQLGESLGALGFLPRFAITVYGMAFYLLKTVVPLHLSPLYPLTPHKIDPAGAPFIMSSIVVVSITAAALLLRHKFPGLLAAWMVYAITLLPVGGIFHNGAQIVADRYTYLACLGWALLAGFGAVMLPHLGAARPAWKVLTACAAGFILIGLGLGTRAQTRIWENSYTLWTRANSVEPSPIAYSHLGSALIADGDAIGAIEEYRRAIALKPDYATAHSNLASALLELQRWEEALQEFRIALRLLPDNAPAHNGMARALAMEGKWDQALFEFQQALRINPDYENARVGMQRVLVLRDRSRTH